MTTIRVLLAVLGIWLAGTGLADLWQMNSPDLISIGFWYAGGILVHDAVFAPLCAALGLTARRLLPCPAWASLACGAVATVALGAVAVPVLAPGGDTDNSTIRDRPYLLGLTIAVVTVWALVALALVGTRRTTPSENT